MYTSKNYKDDINKIATTYYVKAIVLKEVVERKITHEAFLEHLDENQVFENSANILKDLQLIMQKIQQNGNKLDLDPAEKANNLKKEGHLKDAYLTILPALQSEPHNEDYRICFFWIMYDYLKKTQQNSEQYYRSLKNLNTHFRFNMAIEKEKELLNRVLWNVYQFVKVGESQAKLIFDEFMILCNNSNQFMKQSKPHTPSFSLYAKRIQRLETQQISAGPVLVKKLSTLLDDQKFFALFDMVGFDWFEEGDYKKQSDKKDPEKTYPPLAETILGTYSKRLIEADEVYATQERLEKALQLVTKHIQKNPSYEWLPYYKIKLLMCTGDRQEAFKELTVFARKKSHDFWIWDLLSTFLEKDEAFNCLCMALCTKTKEEMLCKTQEKMIPLLLERGRYSEAKYELDLLLKVRKKKNWKISQQHIDWQQESWYTSNEAVQNRDNLQTYADQAKKIIYSTLPYEDIFVNYINEEKEVVNFIYLNSLGDIQDGYFYMSDLLKHNSEWKVNQPYKLQMFKPKIKSNLFQVMDAQEGDALFTTHFIKECSGSVSRHFGNEYAFVDDVYIPSYLVKKYQLSDFEEIKYVKKRNYNKKKEQWGWQVIDITQTEEESNEFLEEEE